MISKLVRGLKIILLGLIAGYFIFMAALYVFQDNIIFYTQPLTQERKDYIDSRKTSIESVSLTTVDNEVIKGWYVKSPKVKPNILIYFGGNAEEVSDMVEATKYNEDWSLVLMNYRGYGESTGNPNERNLFNDSLLIYDHFIGSRDASYSKIVIMGRSLGSGVAIYLADNRKVDGLILTTPYDSILNLAKTKFNMIPINILLHERFESDTMAPRIKVPVLALMASNDTIVPNSNTDRLSSKFAGKVQLVKIMDANHNTIGNTQQYWKSIREYLDAMGQANIKTEAEN